MTEWRQVAGRMEVYLPSHLGGQAVAPSGGTVSLTVPSGTRSALLIAEGGAAYYEINGTAAGTASSGYLPQDILSPVFDIDNMGTISVSAGSSITVHAQYYS